MRPALLGGLLALTTLAASAAAQLQCSQIVTAGGPASRTFGAAYDSARGRTILFGGERLGVLRNELYEWDGASWTSYLPAVAPGPRGRPALAFDEARGRTLIFGGISPSNIFLSDTWTYDGNYAQSMVLTRPSPRSAAAMAYDPTRQMVVLFGGFVPLGTDSAETWEWDGSAWSQRMPSVSPSARGAHRMVYDASRDAVVMFGGWRTPLQSTVGDTWEWDGANWTAIATAAPPSRCDQAMVFDEKRGRTVMFGGLSAFQQPGNVPVTLGDFWVLGPSGWQLKIVSGLPSPRTDMLGQYDRVNQEVVLHGGWVSGLIFNQTFSAATAQPAAMAPYGVGCVGSNGVPELSPDSAPWIGDYYQVSVTNVVPSTVGFLAIGFSDTSWNGLSVPVDLAQFGLPGCLGWLGPDLSVVFPVQNGTGSWGLNVCNCPFAVGVSYSMQAIVLDPGSTRPLGAAVSNALRATIGNW